MRVDREVKCKCVISKGIENIDFGVMIGVQRKKEKSNIGRIIGEMYYR